MKFGSRRGGWAHFIRGLISFALVIAPLFASLAGMIYAIERGALYTAAAFATFMFSWFFATVYAVSRA